MNFTGTIMKNLFSKPVTTSYPFEPRVYPERTRGHIEIAIEDCIYCGMCMRSCPANALSVDRKEGTWSIDRFMCIQCGYCVEKCPKKCLNIIPGYPEPMPEKSIEVHHKPETPADETQEPAASKPAEAKSPAEAAPASPEA